MKRTRIILIAASLIAMLAVLTSAVAEAALPMDEAVSLPMESSIAVMEDINLSDIDPDALLVEEKASYDYDGDDDEDEDEDEDEDDEDNEYTITLTAKNSSRSAKVGDVIDVDLGGYTGSGWKSSDKKVAKVNSNGIVKCLKAGKASITVTVKKNKKKVKLTLALKVIDPNAPKHVYIAKTTGDEDFDEDNAYYFTDKDKWIVMPGDSGEMHAAVTPANASQTVTWKTSNKKVFKLSSSGAYKALKPGSVTVTATAKNGVKKTLKVTVKKNAYKASYSDKALKKILSEAVEDEEVAVRVKSLEVESSKKINATLILFNGTGTKISKLKNFDITINAGYYDWDDDEADYDFDSEPGFDEFISATIKSVKVNCGKRAKKEFKVTFSGDDILNANYRLADPGFAVECYNESDED